MGSTGGRHWVNKGLEKGEMKGNKRREQGAQTGKRNKWRGRGQWGRLVLRVLDFTHSEGKHSLCWHLPPPLNTAEAHLRSSSVSLPNRPSLSHTHTHTHTHTGCTHSHTRCTLQTTLHHEDEGVKETVAGSEAWSHRQKGKEQPQRAAG